MLRTFVPGSSMVHEIECFVNAKQYIKGFEILALL
jgi:hypothetical protein